MSSPVVALQATSYPAPSPTDTVQYEEVTSIGATTVTAIRLSTTRTKVGMARCKIKWMSGTGATFTPLIFSASGVTTAGDIQQEFAGTATAVATLFDPSIDPFQNIFYTDENGYIYLVLGPNAGSDNVFRFSLRFLVFR